MTAPRLTPAMVAALRLANQGRRLFRGERCAYPVGGWPHPVAFGVVADAVAHGWLRAEGAGMHETWTLTAAGRDALAAIDADAREDASK